MNVKQLLIDWENEEIELNSSTFKSPSELAQFIIYGFNSLAEDEFEILIEDIHQI